jgi:hypothetical protein
MDLWQLIASHRDGILELTQEVAGAIGGGVKSRERLFAQLRREMERYMSAMEEAVHPALARDMRTHSYVADLEQEHAEIRRHIGELAAAPAKDSRDWTRRYRALVFALEHYFSLQEHGAFTVARGTLGERAEALARAFAREHLAALQAQRWHLPKAMAPARYGVSMGTALATVLGVLTLAVAAAGWRHDLGRRASGADLKRRSQQNRALREEHPAWMY